MPESRPGEKLPLIWKILLFPFIWLYRFWLYLFGPDPLVIASPRAGECVEKSFTVSGSYQNGILVTVSLTMEGRTGNDTAMPDWDVPFAVSSNGTCTATATASGASAISTTFNVSDNCLISLDPPEPEEEPAPPAPPPEEKKEKMWRVRIKGKCPDAFTVLQAHLDKLNGPNEDTIPLQSNGAGRYNEKFNKKVPKGLYLVRVELRTDATTVKTSRMVKVG